MIDNKLNFIRDSLLVILNHYLDTVVITGPNGEEERALSVGTHLSKFEH